MVALPLLVATFFGTSPSIETPLVLNDDGGWCWFQDERAVLHNDHLTVGSVAQGRHQADRKGNVELTSIDLTTGVVSRAVLHRQFQADDHDCPALLVRPDRTLLAMYCRHGSDDRIYYRIARRPADITQWADEQTFVPSRPASVTYSNLFRLSSENGGRGRSYNFYRGHGARFKPSWMSSDDDGATWQPGGVLIDFPAAVRHRPYVKYAANNVDTVHFVFTEGHPRDFDNSIYHARLSNGVIHRSDGVAIRGLRDGPIVPVEATRLFAGDPDNVAWPQDLHLDEHGRPYVVYSVQKNSAGLPTGKGGDDHRYRYARWDGARWHDYELAYAGRRLYAGEDDYTGGACLHPGDLNTVFLSSSVHPATGESLASGHYEIFLGRTCDSGHTWRWTTITPDATVDHLRPIVPIGATWPVPVLWLRGDYTSYTHYELEVVLQRISAPRTATDNRRPVTP